ncbi:rRNA maturation RNase YbeY [Jeotgalibacillus haloalkalitolerans]|uniref:Endoribonuclease YbeY n=1 Tax=Jeotgalibacillus haloalkalitolerans TaxID=3104292 RepID=A0ABU5KLT5_9BACL|nr:rRNA maturation RNase YbeY [Jeotgalibacillus sp. HH7-29]MDZ5712206.1 rRNA maturation RNase YbeY [Jeotgalibacillus sp. HH7-29]
MTTLHIDFLDETELLSEKDSKLISDLLSFAAKEEGIDEAECSISFVTNEQIRVINKDYRGKDKPTDVISFALEEMTEEEMAVMPAADMPRMLGDIIISVEKAKEQAEDYGHSFSRELGFLALHGFLHLLGYDHMTEQDEAAMFGRQDEILKGFGLSRT